MTALTGAYLLVEGVGVVAGGYQNPFELAYERSEGIIEYIDPIFYAYLASTFVVFVLGIIF
jgi:hypothetical protein